MESANDTPKYLIPTDSPDAVKETQSTAAAFNASKPPTVRTTSPSEDSTKRERAICRSSELTKPSIDAYTMAMKPQLPIGSTQAKPSRQNTHDVLASASKARKFHLVKSPSSVPSPSLFPKTNAQKHRDRRRKDLAIFIETPESIRKAKHPVEVSKHSNGDSPEEESIKAEEILRLKNPRKRPNATAAERKWRTETWANHAKPNEVNGTAENISEPSNQWNYDSASLAEQLQAVALEEIRYNEEHTKGLACSGNVKVKPKPPKSRHPEVEELTPDDNGDLTMSDTITLDDGGGYVLDTYIRSSGQPFELTNQANSRHDTLHSIDQDRIGILIVEEEEEEALWEAFAEDQESDPEWNSEDEDENG